MKLKSLLIILTVMVSFVSSLSFAQISEVCSGGVVTLPNGAYIYKNSAPVRSCNSPSCPIVGFRIEPTLLGVRASLNRGGTTIYDKNGNKIGSCPWASAHDTTGGRYRCTMNTGSLRRKAQSNTKSAEGYFTLGSKKCVKIPHLGKCYGSVKGKCTSTY